ncbi:hypothetical protein DL771_007670 [Monosporascus sp. 5C6A]|nr:hypothetical protein DL771_007670 [Monosporascus sp. 5C6A]
MELLFEKEGIEAEITEEVLKAAAGNYWFRDEHIISLLFEKCEPEVKMTEQVFKAALENNGYNTEIMILFFKTEGAEDGAECIMSLLLEKYPVVGSTSPLHVIRDRQAADGAGAGATGRREADRIDFAAMNHYVNLANQALEERDLILRPGEDRTAGRAVTNPAGEGRGYLVFLFRAGNQVQRGARLAIGLDSLAGQAAPVDVDSEAKPRKRPPVAIRGRSQQPVVPGCQSYGLIRGYMPVVTAESNMTLDQVLAEMAPIVCSGLIGTHVDEFAAVAE